MTFMQAGCDASSRGLGSGIRSAPLPQPPEVRVQDHARAAAQRRLPNAGAEPRVPDRSFVHAELLCVGGTRRSALRLLRLSQTAREHRRAHGLVLV